MSLSADTERVAELAHTVVAEHDPKQVPLTEFLGACYDAGLSWVNFPEGLGGLGLSRGLQAVADTILQGSITSGIPIWSYGSMEETTRDKILPSRLRG